MLFQIEACNDEEFKYYQSHRVIEIDAEDSRAAEKKAYAELGDGFYIVKTSRQFEDVEGWTPVYVRGYERRHAYFDTMPTFAGARKAEAQEAISRGRLD